MKPIQCELICKPYISEHVQQLVTGLIRLHHQRIIKLTEPIVQEDVIEHHKPQHLHDARLAHLSIVLNDSLKLYYDVHDSWEIDEEKLHQVDYYFKRSFAPAWLEALNLGEQRAKIFPLGLNYPVYPSHRDIWAL